MLEGFYKPFHSEVEKALSGTSKEQIHLDYWV